MGEGRCRLEGFRVRASRRTGSGRGTTRASAGVCFLRASGRSKDGSGEIPSPKARMARWSCSQGFGRIGRGEANARMSGSPSAVFKWREGCVSSSLVNTAHRMSHLKSPGGAKLSLGELVDVYLLAV